jgi:hypothetical protein
MRLQQATCLQMSALLLRLKAMIPCYIQHVWQLQRVATSSSQSGNSSRVLQAFAAKCPLLCSEMICWPLPRVGEFTLIVPCLLPCTSIGEWRLSGDLTGRRFLDGRTPCKPRRTCRLHKHASASSCWRPLLDVFEKLVEFQASALEVPVANN